VSVFKFSWKLVALGSGVLALPSFAQEPAADAPTPVVSVGDKGFVLRTPDGAFQLKIRGFVQVDGRAYLADGNAPLTDTFLLRRVRPYFDATIFDLFDVRIMPDFAGGTFTLFDAYVEVRPRPWLRLRAGKFKPAYGLERLQGAANTHFVERAFPSSLAPNRDTGIQLQGEIAKGALTYALGLFNGVVDGTLGDNDTNENKEVLGRVFAHPLRLLDIEALNDFGVGVAASYGRQSGTSASGNLPSYRSPGQQTFFSYATDAAASGERLRVIPQLYFYYGSIGLLAEYALSAQEVTRGAETARLANRAWQATVTYVLTSDKASYEAIAPTKPLNLEKGQIGAVELAARYHELRVDPAAFPTFADPLKAASRAQAFAGGVNWYPNRIVRVSLDFEHTEFVGGAASGDREPENALLGRLQASF
jgi:phosphate-selective porin OprO and OprP